MDADTNTAHTALSALAAILHGSSVIPREEGYEFTKCSGFKVNGDQCSNPIGALRRESAISLYACFSKMEVCPMTEAFFEQLTGFLNNTHCGIRVVKPSVNLERWKYSWLSAKMTANVQVVEAGEAERDLTGSPGIPDASVKVFSASTLTVGTIEHEPSSQVPDDSPPTYRSPAYRSPTCESIHGNDDSTMDDGESVLDHQTVKPPEPQPADDSVFGSTDGLQAINRRPVAAHPATDTRLSTASYAPADNSLLVPDASKPHQPPSPPSSEGDSAIVMEAVTDPSASLEVTPSEEVSAVEAAEAANAILDDRVFALVAVEFRRKSSVRDPSPFLAEMYKYLTETQRREGIVYVLAHTEDPALFKIGYTGFSAENRLAQSNHCYKANTQIIHETQGGPFFEKAEKLARLALRNENLVVTACLQCGKRHREWFRTSRETVIETVESMERLVKLPA
ncbi:hypothetical protein HYQ45_013232 [Verticillium longisporum]